MREVQECFDTLFRLQRIRQNRECRETGAQNVNGLAPCVTFTFMVVATEELSSRYESRRYKAIYTAQKEEGNEVDHTA
jgi:hypothetical protein